MSKNDEQILNRILIRLRLYCEFAQMSGLRADDIDADKIANMVSGELKNYGITGKRARAIMLAVSDGL